MSDPSSPSYGVHLSTTEVHDLVAPDSADVVTVVSWLESVIGASGTAALSRSPNSDFIFGDISAAAVEALTRSRLGLFIHNASGVVVARLTDRERLPAAVAAAVDFVSPSTRFPVVRRARAPADAAGAAERGAALVLGVTVESLRALYGTTGISGKAQSNIQAVAQFLGQYMAPSDLQLFFNAYDKEAAGRTRACGCCGQDVPVEVIFEYISYYSLLLLCVRRLFSVPHLL